MSISAWLAEVVADRDIHELSVRNREMEVWPQGPGCKFNEEWHFSGLRSEWTRGVTLPRFLEAQVGRRGGDSARHLLIPQIGRVGVSYKALGEKPHASHPIRISE